jgi:cellulose synthase/poly-beta-1,6-N-acetylglucosamine synthase-like glycosyltransferase
MSQRNETKGIVSGILLLIGLHIAALILGTIALSIYLSVGVKDNSQGLLLFAFLAAGVGIVQLIYVIPAIFILRRRRNFTLVKGVIIGAVITALLNGGCWLLVYSGSR